MRIVLVFLSVLLTQAVAAQRTVGNGNSTNNGSTQNGNAPSNNNALKADSSNKRKAEAERDFTVKIIQHTFLNPKDEVPKYFLDTLHYKPGIKYTQQDLGNTGSGVYNLDFNIKNTATRQLGQTIFNSYIKSVDEVPFYNTTKPYTDFQFIAGRPQEQGGRFLHTRNIDSFNNYSFFYSKTGAPGYFRYQRATQDQLLLSAQIKPTPNSRWSTQLAFAMHQFRQDENGGILDDTDLIRTNFRIRKILPVYFGAEGLSDTRSVVRNYYRSNDFKILNSIQLAKPGKKSLLPNIAYILHIKDEKLSYQDYAPDLVDYPYAPDTILFKSTDTLLGRQQLFTIQNEFGSAVPKFLKGKAALEAFFGIEVQRFKNDTIKDNNFSNYIRAQVSSLGKSSWTYQANALLYVAGNNFGNYSWNASAGKKIKQWKINLGGEQSLQSLPFAWGNFSTQRFTITNSADKQFNTRLFAQAIISYKDSNKYKPLLSIEGSSQNLYNYFYFDSTFTVQQYSSLISIPSLKAQAAQYFGKIQTYQDAYLQVIPKNAPINAPTFIGKLGVAYKDRLYKKLSFIFGAEATYNSKFYTPRYMYQVQQFGFSQNYLQNNLPNLSCYLNANLKRFNAYFVATEMQQPMVLVNRILVEKYPAQDLYLRVGFSWVMIN